MLHGLLRCPANMMGKINKIVALPAAPEAAVVFELYVFMGLASYLLSGVRAYKHFKKAPRP